MREEPQKTGNLTIGELSTATGVTPEAIRYYEQEGVLPPAARVGVGRYRRYNQADAERLRFVRRTRELGFSLPRVRDLLDLAQSDPNRPCGEVNKIARAHLSQVDAKLAQLTALRTELDRLIVSCDSNVGIGDCTLLSALSDAG